MTNSQFGNSKSIVNVYKNMTNGQFCCEQILTIGHFCDTIGTINKMTVGHN